VAFSVVVAAGVVLSVVALLFESLLLQATITSITAKREKIFFIF
jgi:hypothetical protein